MSKSLQQLLAERDRLVLAAERERQALSEEVKQLTPSLRWVDRGVDLWHRLRSPLLALPMAFGARLLWRHWRERKGGATSESSQDADNKEVKSKPHFLFRHGLPLARGAFSLWRQHRRRDGKGKDNS